MFEDLGRYLGETIYMSTQNEPCLGISCKRNFDFHFRCGDMAQFVCPYREAIRLQCLPPTRYVRDDPLPSMLEVGFQCFPDRFFY